MQYGTQCGIGLLHCEICDLVQLTAQCLKCNIVSFWSALKSSFSLLWKLSLISKNVSDMCRITRNAELFYGRQNYTQPKAFEYLGDRMYIEMSIQYSLNNLAYPAKNKKKTIRCCKPFTWLARITLSAWRFFALCVIRLDIPIRHGYCVFRVVLPTP